jgi:hypothetical protein
MTLITNGELLGQLQKSIADDPSYADQYSLMDRWDRENFAVFVATDIDPVEWLDLLDYCKHETAPWPLWFEEWKEGFKYDTPIRSPEHAAFCRQEVERRYHGKVVRDGEMFVVVDENDNAIATDKVLRQLSFYKP